MIEEGTKNVLNEEAFVNKNESKLFFYQHAHISAVDISMLL